MSPTSAHVIPVNVPFKIGQDGSRPLYIDPFVSSVGLVFNALGSIGAKRTQRLAIGLVLIA